MKITEEPDSELELISIANSTSNIRDFRERNPQDLPHLRSFPNPPGKLIRLYSILKGTQNPPFLPHLDIRNKSLDLIQIRIIIPLIHDLFITLGSSNPS